MGDRVEGDQVQICGAMGDILNRIGDKWSVMVVGHLTKKTMRFNELRHSIGGISQRMLTLTLRNLERDGLVIRTVYPEIPPRVEYQLTDKGRDLWMVNVALAEWGDRWDATGLGAPPALRRDRLTGRPVELALVDAETREVLPADRLSVLPGPGLKAAPKPKP